MSTPEPPARPGRGWQLSTATPDDVPEIAVFQTETWREAYGDVVDPAYLAAVGVPERVASWGLRVGSSGRHVVVARAPGGDAAAAGPAEGPAEGSPAGEVVGVVSWADGDPGRDPFDLGLVELKTLYLAAPWRGTGLADELLRRAVGDGPAYLWAFERNPRALAFYARHGFVPDGTRKLDVPTDAWELRLVRGAAPAR